MSGIDYWMYGEQSELAEQAGVRVQYVNDVLKGRRKPGAGMAQRLADASAIIGKRIPIVDWLDPVNSRHVAFEQAVRDGR